MVRMRKKKIVSKEKDWKGLVEKHIRLWRKRQGRREDMRKKNIQEEKGYARGMVQEDRGP